MMRVKIKNFLSIEEIDLDLNGSYIIIGENRDEGGSNGSGKSAIIEAIIFGLYGEVLRGSQKEIIRKGEKLANVLVEFDGIKIEREVSVNSNTARLKEGKELITGVQNVNKYIEERFGSFDEFILANYFSDIHRFSKLSETQRKELISKFANLELVDELLELVKEEGKNIDLRLKELEVLLMTNERRISEVERKMNEIDEKLKVKPEKVDKSILEYYTKLTDEIAKLENKQRLIKQEMENIQKTLKMLEKKVCPVCRRPFTDEKQLNELKGKADSDLKKLEEEFNKEKIRLESLKKEYDEKYKDFNIREYLMKVEYATKYEELKNIKRDLEKDLLNSKKLIKQYTKELDKFKELKEISNFWKNKLGYKGIKSMLLESFLNSFEERINEYLEKTDLGYTIAFKSFQSERGIERLQIVMMDKAGERDISLISQGEKRKLDICFMFALNDFLPEKVKFNYMFFDEALDGLDIPSIQKVLDILDNSERNYLLVSHIDLDFKLKKIKVVKENGKSYIQT